MLAPYTFNNININMRSTVLRPLIRSTVKGRFGNSQCLICSFSRRTWQRNSHAQRLELNSTIKSAVPGTCRRYSRQPSTEEAPNEAAAFTSESLGSEILSALESSSSPSEAARKAREEISLDDIFVPPDRCPGCGARSQTKEPGKCGYYSARKKREWLPRKVFRGLTATQGPVEGQQREKVEGLFAPVLPVLEEPILDAKSRDVPVVLLPDTRTPQITSPQEGEEDDMLFTAQIPDNMEEYEKSTAEIDSEMEEEHETLREEEGGVEEGKEAEEQPKEDPMEVELREKFFAEQEKLKPPLCGRCHSLLHHKKGIPLEPPTFAMVTDPIIESYFPNIYIYHVVDAADFPLSVLPGLRRNILRHLPSTRSVRRNVQFSLIVTRADLLMPKETMVSSLMTYLRNVLKEALPEWMKTGEIRVVSAKNTWTTERVKKEIRGLRGSVYLIGRTNVGKSRLFESVYPRNNQIRRTGKSGWGRGDGVERGGFDYDTLQALKSPATITNPGEVGQRTIMPNGESMISSVGRSKGYQFVEMPTVNEMPGTTAGAVRVPFSNGKGELVDLPGLGRGTLLDYVRDDCIKDTVMTNRITPEQYVLKPGQSLLLGGIIRIAAVTEKVTLVAYPFLTLPVHVTNEARALELLDHPDPASMRKPPLWSKPHIGESMKSAGRFALGWDVTQRRDRRLKHHTASEMAEIPYKIYSTDLLVEGCGWVELVTSVLRWKDAPVIEVWSPLGKGIGSRPPMGAQALCEKKKKARPGSRPKRSMKGRAKEARKLAREAKVPEFWKKINTMAREARQPRLPERAS